MTRRPAEPAVWRDPCPCSKWVGVVIGERPLRRGGEWHSLRAPQLGVQPGPSGEDESEGSVREVTQAGEVSLPLNHPEAAALIPREELILLLHAYAEAWRCGQLGTAGKLENQRAGWEVLCRSRRQAEAHLGEPWGPALLSLWDLGLTHFASTGRENHEGHQASVVLP
jgi:hypothetical protein